MGYEQLWLSSSVILMVIVNKITTIISMTKYGCEHSMNMALLLHGDSSNIRVGMQLHLYEEQIKYLPRITDWKNPRNKNDNNDDNTISPKASFKHHGPLITPPWRFAPKRENHILTFIQQVRPKYISQWKLSK